jgi:hypothetical protein
MRRSFGYSAERREIRVSVPRDYVFRGELLRTLERKGLILIPSINVPRRRRHKTIVLTLAQQSGQSASNSLERLADWLSKVPGHRAVHDPWERGDEPVDIRLAVGLIVDTILNFDEKKLRMLPI